jgi:adenylate cyclase, class 2
MIEAEYKARLRNPDTVRRQLRERARPDIVTYHDTYLDDAQKKLSKADQELRLRTIESGASSTHLLTFKDAAIDRTTGSKPEYETSVSDRSMLDHIIHLLGYSPVISFSKECENYRFATSGRDVLATIVTVPEIQGTYLELETQASPPDLDAALADLRTILIDLDVTSDELTTELYTDAVTRERALARNAGTM